MGWCWGVRRVDGWRRGAVDGEAVHRAWALCGVSDGGAVLEERVAHVGEGLLEDGLGGLRGYIWARLDPRCCAYPVERVEALEIGRVGWWGCCRVGGLEVMEDRE
jgi:hypothetical protein